MFRIQVRSEIDAGRRKCVEIRVWRGMEDDSVKLCPLGGSVVWLATPHQEC
jgi:hypothetical protein